MRSLFRRQDRPSPRSTRSRPPLEIRLLLATASLSAAYAALLVVGLIPAASIVSAGAFAVLGLALFALSWRDPAWAPASMAIPVRSSALLPTPSPRRPATRAPATSPAAPVRRPVPRPALAAVRADAPPRWVPPGDALWVQLTPAESGALPSPLAAPIAGSAYAPELEPEEGSPFEAGIGGLSPGFPAAPSWPSPHPVSPGSPRAEETVSSVEREAYNHTPPHLRPSRPAWKELTGLRTVPLAPAGSGGVRCASCRQSLVNPPAWRACTSCRRPFCGECSFRSRRNLGPGRCLDCRAKVEIEEPRFVA